MPGWQNRWQRNKPNMGRARLTSFIVASLGVVLTGVVPAGAGLPQVAAPYQPSQQQKVAKPGVFAPINKAKSVGSQANQKRADEAAATKSMEGLGEALGNAMGEAMGQLVKVLGGAMSELEKNMTPFPTKKGETWVTPGTVAWQHSQNGATMVLVKRPGKDGWTDHFLFRGTHPSLGEASEGQSGRIGGTFTGKDTDAKNKVVNWIFDDARFISNEQWDALQGGGTAAQGEPAQNEKSDASFNSATRGWAFKGTVEGEHGGTVAVFEKPGDKEFEVRLVRDGQLVEPGFRVLSATGGVAEVRVNGTRFAITPW